MPAPLLYYNRKLSLKTHESQYMYLQQHSPGFHLEFITNNMARVDPSEMQIADGTQPANPVNLVLKFKPLTTLIVFANKSIFTLDESNVTYYSDYYNYSKPYRFDTVMIGSANCSEMTATGTTDPYSPQFVVSCLAKRSNFQNISVSICNSPSSFGTFCYSVENEIKSVSYIKIYSHTVFVLERDESMLQSSKIHSLRKKYPAYSNSVLEAHNFLIDSFYCGSFESFY